MDADADARTVVVVAGGEPIDRDRLMELPDADLVIAADSGLDHALRLGLQVDRVVGDLDSVTDDALAAATDAGAVVERHPTDKDHTDLALALDAALAAGATRVMVIGGHGGRLDMALANLLVLASPRYAPVTIEALVGRGAVYVVRGGAGPVEVSGQAGDVLTIVPVHGAAEGIVTEGLRFALDDEDLPPGTTRGCSNELTGPSARVRLRAGTLLCIKPGRPA